MVAPIKIALAVMALATAAVALLPGSATAGGTSPVRSDPQQLRIGGALQGALASDDGRLSRGEFADSYRFRGRRGERVSIELESSDFDTYLILRRPDGEQADNDDRAGVADTNSWIETTLNADGEYEVLVTSYQPGESGQYRLSITPSRGTEPPATARPGPRVYALIVGVSDYGGRTTDLENTDADAKAIAQQLERVGALNPASVVLTNAEATRGSVEQAFAQIARQAGPEDTFLFFFSGHGTRVKSEGPQELDGANETIELRDGPITDVELARLFAPLRTRLAIVALDSCFSGGFNNLISRPNVMGLFSSEEDLTSSVASSYNSGGYLSHFLQAALGGEADENGDTMLTAGELSAYLHRAFLKEGDIPASTEDGRQDYQRLVIARGGVQLDHVIFRVRAPT